MPKQVKQVHRRVHPLLKDKVRERGAAQVSKLRFIRRKSTQPDRFSNILLVTFFDNHSLNNLKKEVSLTIYV